MSKDLDSLDVTEVVHGIRNGTVSVGLPPRSKPKKLRKVSIGPLGRGAPTGVSDPGTRSNKGLVAPRRRKKGSPKTSKRLMFGNRLKGW